MRQAVIITGSNLGDRKANLEKAAAGEALFVYPDGLEQKGGTGWGGRDLPFFDAMVTDISASHCVDSTRIFATGHSNGGYMTNFVGCARSNIVRGIAPVSGGLVPCAASGCWV